MKILAITRNMAGGRRRQHLLSHLAKKASVQIMDVELPAALKIINYVLCLHYRRPLWRERIFKNAFFFCQMSREVRKCVRKCEADVELVFFFEGLYGCHRGDQKSPPYVIYEDTTAAVCRREWPAWIPDTMNTIRYRQLEDGFYQNALTAFGAAEKTTSSFIQDYHLPAARAYNVGMGANLGLRAPDAAKKKNYILFVGYEPYRKGLQILITAFKGMATGAEPLSLYIVGPDIRIAEPHIKVFGRVSSKEKMKQLYDGAAVLVMPSIFDPVPSAVIEAMGRGVPVVVSDGCGAAEIIEHGKDGLIFEKNNTAALTRCLEMIHRDRGATHRMAQKAYEKVAGAYTWDHIADRMLSVISEKLDAIDNHCRFFAMLR